MGLIILNWNGYQDTIECIESIVEYEGNNHSIFILDNGSSDNSLTFIEEWLRYNYKFNYRIVEDTEFQSMSEFEEGGLTLIKGRYNLGFAKGNNLILNKIKSKFEYSFLLNNDTTMLMNSITKMINYMDIKKDTGAASCNIRYFDDKNKLWNAGGRFTWYGDRKYYSQKKIDRYIQEGKTVIETPFVTGCALLIRNEILMKIGVLTEKFFFGEEDFNFCKRLKINNIKVETILSATIYHKVSSSINKTNNTKKKNCNRYILHFSNRIINQKEFYNYNYWFLWRIFYINAIGIKIFMLTKDYKSTIETIQRIRYYTRNFNHIDYELFKEINNK
ncbi:glycosyltransferase [Paenibacillus odorifer]|uniref:glycosyltransferase n=1 Tax=Paenibacillus odorifer TaxID=189426 RepID=UPI002115DDD3|nr:glycosyltransferase family 2 protein [Paenibacillus odorifer]